MDFLVHDTRMDYVGVLLLVVLSLIISIFVVKWCCSCLRNWQRLSQDRFTSLIIRSGDNLIIRSRDNQTVINIATN